jgi:hypothetical protein
MCQSFKFIITQEVLWRTNDAQYIINASIEQKTNPLGIQTYGSTFLILKAYICAKFPLPEMYQSRFCLQFFKTKSKVVWRIRRHAYHWYLYKFSSTEVGRVSHLYQTESYSNISHTISVILQKKKKFPSQKLHTLQWPITTHFRIH